MNQPLTANNHDRDAAGLKYVYPVLSRRAGGLSIGINLNVNNACNWRCIYCQVPNLRTGAAPPVDLALLEKELRAFLADVKHGDFFERFAVASENRAIKDIALSGNGEPTSAKNFAEIVGTIGSIATELGVFPDSRFVLITNGSLMQHAQVRTGLTKLSGFGGEVWFKFDSATDVGRVQINNTRQKVNKALENIELSADLCTTKIQTCVFDYRAQGLTDAEKSAYLEALAKIKQSAAVNEVMLYTLARPSLQPEARDLKPLSVEVMQALAGDIRRLGFSVSVSG